GGPSASPRTVVAEPAGAASPASAMAVNICSTSARPSESWSNAVTSAPRRYASKACRPAPAPMSSSRCPGSTASRSKSTVNIRLLQSALWRMLHRVHIALCGGRGDRGPTVLVQCPLPARATEPCTTLRVGEEIGQCGGERLGVSGGDACGALVFRPDNLGQRAGVTDHERCATGHCLDGGQRESLVQRGDTCDLGGGQQFGEVGVGDPADDSHAVTDVELGYPALGRSARGQFGDEYQLGIPLGAEFGDGLEKVVDALEWHVGAGDRGDAAGDAGGRGGMEHRCVHSQRYRAYSVGVDTEIGGDVGCRVPRDGEQVWNAACDAGLHTKEAVPSTQRELA